MPCPSAAVAGALLAADLVVIGQRPQLDAVGRGARGDRFGFERAVGNGRVAVQVGVGECGSLLSGFTHRLSQAGVVPS